MKGKVITCPVCNKGVYRIPALVNRKFCSRECYILGSKKETMLAKDEVAKDFTREVCVTDKGRVLRKSGGKYWEIKHHDNGNGYKLVTISDRKYYVHRLVAQVHTPTHEPSNEVNHKDGNKSNNHTDNLEWVTRSENHLHAYKLGLKKRPTGNRKLSREQAEQIKALKCTKFYKEIAKDFGVSYSTVAHIMRGSRWNYDKQDKEIV